MTLFLIALATFCATLIGGLCALKFRDHLHLVLGFTAGAVLGVAFFDLLPESIHLGESFRSPAMTATLIAGGFFIYLLLDRLIFLHAHLPAPWLWQAGNHAPEEEEPHAREANGTLGAAALSLHSLLDGVAIGLAFQVSAAVGTIVAVAVLTHDFSDGINTVNFILRHAGGRSRAIRWLLMDAIAPVVGVASTLFFTLSESSLGVMLSLFTGFFIYIGASDLVPESQHAHPKLLTTFMTLLGAAVLWGVIRLAGA